MHRENIARPPLSSHLTRIPADDWPQRMTVLGRAATLILMPAFFLLMVGATTWLALLVVSLGLQAPHAPLWLLVFGLPFITLLIVWQSAEIYREIALIFYRGAVGMIERGVAIIFAGSAEAFGASQQALELFYAGVCVALIPIAAWATHAFANAAPLVFLQNVLNGSVQWSKVPVLTAIEAAAYVVMVALIFLLSSTLAVSKKFRSVLTRPKLTPCIPNARMDEATSHEFRVAHLSDLHAMADGQTLAENPRRSVPINVIAELFSSLSRVPGLDSIVVSGDLTDKGDIDSWKALLSCAGVEEAAARIVMAPGNHDLNPIEPGFWRSLRNFADLRRTGQNLRALRYLQVANAIMGERAELICPYTQRLTTLSRVMARAQPDIDAWSGRKSIKDHVRKRSLLPRDLLEKCFPMRVTVGGTSSGSGPSFLVWNSVSSTAWPLLNAVGNIDDTQIERASKLISASHASALVHVMHHQIAQPSPKDLVSPAKRAIKDRVTSGWTVLMRATSVIDWIESLGQRTVILHGHKHKHFVADLTDGQATIVSAPSGTLGCEESFVHGFAHSDKGFWLDLRLTVQGAHTQLRGAEPREVPASRVALASKGAPIEAASCHTATA